LQLPRVIENCRYLVIKYLRRLDQTRQQLVARWQKRKEAKLYRQWVTQADLPPEAVPTEADKTGTADATPLPRAAKVRISPNLRYFLLVVAFLIVCAVLIAIVARFC